MFWFRPKEQGLKACRSAPHRAVAGLLSLAIDRERHAGLEEYLAASDPMALAEIAQAHYVDTVLATAFENHPELAELIPDDLLILLGKCRPRIFGVTRRCWRS